MQMPSLSELLSIFFDKKYDEKKKWFFWQNISYSPPSLSTQKKINQKKSLPSTHKNSFFFLTAMIYFIFGLKRNGMKL